MKLTTLSIIVLLAAECATTQAATSTNQATAPHVSQPAVATSLAFDPPVQSHLSPSVLWRDDRQPAAFAGYQELSVENYDLVIDDNQNFDDGLSNYQRDAQVERIGVTYR